MSKFTLVSLGAGFIGGILGSLVLAATPASAGTFVESNTSAALRGSAGDSVITTVNYGVYGNKMEGSLGVGYASDNDEAVIRGEYRVYTTLSKDITLEGEVEALYGTSSDNLEVRPELRLRKYF